MSLNPRVTPDESTTGTVDRTLEWDAADYQGYRLYIDGQPATRTWRIGVDDINLGPLAHDSVPRAYRLSPMDEQGHVGAAEEVTWPKPPPGPSPLFGSELQKIEAAIGMAPESPGSLRLVATEAELRAAAASGTSGERIRATQPITLTQELYLARSGTAAAPLTIEGPLRGQRVLLNNHGYWHVRFQHQGGSEIFKPEQGAHHFICDGGGRVSFGQKNMGFMVPDATVHHAIFRNHRLHQIGVGQPQPNQRHGIYVAHATDTIGIWNIEGDDITGSTIQLYPGPSGVIVACVTGIDNISAMMVEGGSNHRIVGLLAIRSSESAVWSSGPVPGAEIFDSLGVSSGPFLVGPKRTNCIAGTEAQAKGLIQQARYGYVPPFDIDGAARVRADAGAKAL
jgi:hypothetical protein